MTFKKLIFTQIFISAILASPTPQIGGFDLNGMLGTGGGLTKTHHGNSRSGFDREATTGLLNGGIGAANGLVKVGSAEETVVEERAVEAPVHQESQQFEHEAEPEAEHETEPEAELEFADARASHLHSHFSPENELFFGHHHISPEEQLFLESEGHISRDVPAEHVHEEITFEEKPHEPVVVESKPENFGFNSFMPDFAKSFFSDESA